MTIKVNLFYLFIFVVAIQLSVPATMIYSHETALRRGTAFKFKTAPIDPLDPFRGRYVRLNIESNSAPVADDDAISKNAWVYVTVKTDKDGFARLTETRTHPPEHSSYLRLKIKHSYSGTAHFELPFDRYYAEENLAPEIEHSYAVARRNSREKAYVKIRVYNGTGVIEDLYLEDLPVMAFIAREAKKSK